MIYYFREMLHSVSCTNMYLRQAWQVQKQRHDRIHLVRELPHISERVEIGIARNLGEKASEQASNNYSGSER